MKPFCRVSGADPLKGQGEPHRIHRLVLDSCAWRKAWLEAWHLGWELRLVAHQPGDWSSQIGGLSSQSGLSHASHRVRHKVWAAEKSLTSFGICSCDSLPCNLETYSMLFYKQPLSKALV